MKSFKDDKGRPWNVSATIGSLRRVRDLKQVDLTELSKGDPPLGARLTSDPFLVADVLEALLGPQLEAASVKPEDLQDALGGEGLAGGFAALAEELLDFFQKTGRPAEAATLTAQMRLLTAAGAKVKAKVESWNMDRIADQVIAEACSTPAMKLLESSASSPTA